MKKTIALVLTLLLVLLPQSALAAQTGQALQNGMPKPVYSPEAVPVESAEDLAAIEELLSGIDYENEEMKVVAWSDEDLGNVMYSKLLADFFRNGEGSYLENVGMAYNSYSDSAFSVDMELVQQITRESFGLEFPTDLSLNWIYVSGDELVIEIASGEGGELSVQECVKVGNTVLAAGTAVFHYGVGSEFEGHFLATLKEAPGSVYGYRLISMKPIEDSKTLRNLTAYASSELIETSNAHVATNVLDDDLSTTWCESVDGVGVGEWIMLETMDGSKMHISAIEWLLGYQKSDEHLTKNGWPWEVLIETQGGYAQRVEFSDYNDAVLLNTPVETQWIKFTILDAEAGSKFEDTCITEIKLHGVDAEPCFREYIAEMPAEEITPTEPEPPSTEPAETEPPATEPPTTEPEPPSTEPAETEPSTTEPEPEETESTEDKKFPWEIDREDRTVEDRERVPEKNQDNMILFIAVGAAAVVIIVLLVVLIIVISKKKKK